MGKKIVLFGAVGLFVSLAIAGLASVAPGVFGWLTLPFWFLPAIANRGAHDVGWPLFLLSGTLCYGGVALLIFSIACSIRAALTATENADSRDQFTYQQ